MAEREIKWIVIRIKADQWIPVNGELQALKDKIEKAVRRSTKQNAEIEIDVTYRTKPK